MGIYRIEEDEQALQFFTSKVKACYKNEIFITKQQTCNNDGIYFDVFKCQNVLD